MEATKWNKDTKGTQEEGFYQRGERSNIGECVEMEKLWRDGEDEDE